jgi:hypothetical protein
MNSASYGVGPRMPGYYNELVYDAVQVGSATGDAVLVSRGGSRLAAAASAAR